MSFLPSEFPGSRRKAPAGYDYFLPASLQASRALNFIDVMRQVQDASLALGEFASLIKKMPNPDLFMRAYTNKEATLSSRIEGTQTSIVDAFKEEKQVAPEKRNDWHEVSAYIKAIKHATDELEKLPLCNRLIKSAHRILLSQSRGKNKQPGEFRNSQNWIGGSRPGNAHFVPPSHEHVAELMSDLEKFIQDQNSPLPELIDAALIHYQFETIHPFLDGNGRMGRMLISLYLLERKILKYPILYISTFLEQHRKDYYLMLDNAREHDDGVIKWVSFFLDAVAHTAKDGIQVTQALLDYDARARKSIPPALGRRTEKGINLLEHLYHNPVVTTGDIQRHLGYSPPLSQILVKKFVDLGILVEMTGQKRNRKFVFRDYVDLLVGQKRQ